MTKTIQEELASSYALTPNQIRNFRKDGYIKLKNVLTAETIAYMNETITSEVKRLNTQHLAIEDRDTYGKAFLQIMNIWTKSDSVKEIVFSTKLAQIATELLGVKGVRLYHDQALYKEPGGGHTPWHADQYYWPLSNDNTVTIWIPMQETPLELGPLEFSAGSYMLNVGRNLEIGDESQEMLENILKENKFQHIIEPFELGEVSFHAGWLFHRAGANNSNQMRSVMTMIYMDKDIKIKKPENQHQQNDWDSWCPGAVIGEVVNTPINPILYQK